MFAKKVSSNWPKKQFLNSYYLRKKTLNSRIVLFKFYKENQRVQSKTLDVSFSIVSFWDKNRLFCDFVHLHIAIRSHIFSTYNDTISVVERTPHSVLSSFIFVIGMMLTNVFVCPYSFVNITVILFHFYYLIFCFKFCYPTVDIIVNHLYLLFLRSRKTNTKCWDKNKKNPQWYHLGVAGNVCN